MSEMLGNYYFMVENYWEAAKEYEASPKFLQKDHILQIKLIICYTQTDRIQHSLNLLYELLCVPNLPPLSIDPIIGGCPCKKIIEKYEQIPPEEINPTFREKVLGVMWTFCDPNRAVDYFYTALQIEPENKILDKIYHKLTERIKLNQLSSNQIKGEM